MSVTRKEEINPAVPDKKRILVLLDKGGQNWYLRMRVNGRYRHASLGTSDLTEARKKAFLEPPEVNEKYSYSVKKALFAFQESRHRLLDAPGEEKSIRLNTFKTYKARVQALIRFFDYQRVLNKSTKSKTVGSLTEGDFGSYRNWREMDGIMISTIKTEITQINTILSWLYDNQYIPRPIKLKIPVVDRNKYRQPNRLFTEQEKRILEATIKKLLTSGDPEKQKRWRLYSYWFQWLEETFSRPHECRLLTFGDVNEYQIDGKTVVQFTTRPDTKTGERLVYARSSVKSKLIHLYQSWGIQVTPSSKLFLLPSGKPPSSSWFSEKWTELREECGFHVKPRELTQYSLRHQGINELLVQGVPPTKVADLAGHSLAIQQRIYKKYSLAGDHSVLRADKDSASKKMVETSTNADLPYPWEIDPDTGEWFPD